MNNEIGTIGGNAVTAQKDLEKVINKLGGLYERANRYGDQLTEFNDRVSGCVPENPSGIESQTNSDNLLDRIRDNLNLLDYALDKIEQQVSRANEVG